MNFSKTKIDGNVKRVDFISKSYFQPIVVVLLMIIFIGFAIRPSILTALKLRKELNEYKLLNAKYDEKITNLRQMRETYDSISDNIPLIQKALPVNPDEGEFLNQLNFLAAKSQINLENLNFSYSENEGLGEIEFSASLMGDYVKILAFLESLNQLLRVTVIDQLNFAPEKVKIYEKNKSGTDVKIDISGRTFYDTK